MKYKYVCYSCKKEYNYNVGRCTQLIENTIGKLIFCNGKVRVVKDETTESD